MANFEKMLDQGTEKIKKVVKIGAIGIGLGLGINSPSFANEAKGGEINQDNVQNNSEFKKERERTNTIYSHGARYDYIINDNKRSQALKKSKKPDDTGNKDKSELKPDDYDLKKNSIPKLIFLSGLEERESLKEPDIKQYMEEYLKRAQVFADYEDINGAIKSLELELVNLRKGKKKGGAVLEGYRDPSDEKIIEVEENLKEFAVKLENNQTERKFINQEKFANLILKDSYKQYIELAPKIFGEVEDARKEAKRLISGDNYLTKLQAELGCSREKARQHQQTRLANIDFINYDFLSSAEIADIAKKANAGNPVSFRVTNSNFITLPFDLEEKINEDGESWPSLFELSFHEFIHCATNSESGMSAKAAEILSKKSFQEMEFKNEEEAKSVNAYYSESGERYARYKALEFDLAKFGVKKINEEFTFEIYKEMMTLYKDDKLSQASKAFIDFTKGSGKDEEAYKCFREIFNEVASLESEGDNQEKIYFHSGWDYKT